MPPLTTSVFPVMYVPWQSFQTQSAISSGWAGLPSGMVWTASSIRPPSRVPGVSTHPGAMPLTVMLSSLSSVASERVRERTAALDAL